MICLSVVIEAPFYKMTAFASESEIETFMGFIAKKVNIIILIMKLFIGFDNMYIYSMHFWCVCMVFQYLILLHCNLLHIKHVNLSPCQLY